MPKMLIAETQPEYLNQILLWFSREEYLIEVVRDGSDLSRKLRFTEYDVILLDRSLAGVDGTEICRSLRETAEQTVLLVLYKEADRATRQAILDAGADDFVKKSISLQELSDRVRALLCRSQPRGRPTLKIGDVEMDVTKGIVTKNGAPIHLYPLEFELLHFLLSHRNQAFPAYALYKRLWPDKDKTSTATVRTYIKTLRRKINTIGQPSLITTVPGKGYKIAN